MKTIYLTGKRGDEMLECAHDHFSAGGAQLQDGWALAERNDSQYANLESVTYGGIRAIRECEFLIAILSTSDCFESISEIAYAHAKGKDCFLWIKNDFQYEEHCDQSVPSCIRAYGYIANMIEPMSFDLQYFNYCQWRFNERFENVEDFISDHILLSSDEMTCVPFIDRILASKNCTKSNSPDLSKCQSPIEESFLAAAWNDGLRPTPQFPAGRFFLDFAFPESRVCVELDGHDYHKTKEQRTSDAQRQRWLEMNNWRVIRFTGTEVHKNVGSCVKQTIAFLNKVNETNGIDSITGG